MKERIFEIACGNKETSVAIDFLSEKENVSEYRIAIKMPSGMRPEPVRIVWHERMAGMLSVWHPDCGRDHAMKQWFSPTVCRSSFQHGAPVLSVLGKKDMNRLTVALSDPVTPSEISFWVDDLPQKYETAFSVTVFSEGSDAVGFWEAVLRIDEREIPVYDAVGDVYPFWKKAGYAIPEPPPAAEAPLYSSWYNFHQAPEEKALLEEMKIASKLGFRMLILDDGWQFAGPSSGNYEQCGAWEMDREKFPDFKGFVSAVHELGIGVMVWFAVPFIGLGSPLFERFRGKYLAVEKGNYYAGILDIRYPEVRRYLLDTYRRFLLEYDIDGFKLDFIDAFRERDDTAPFDPAAMDTESVGGAVRKLLEEIGEGLSKIKPGLLFEYRQNYVGPAVNRFGNMLRVGDCAYDSITNRVGICDLRLLGYPVAVHSDMLYWSPEEDGGLIRKQLLNILFAVPQISVILRESTEEQKACLKSFLRYWQENRDVLLHGAFRPHGPDAGYPLIEAEGGKKTIAVLHGIRQYEWKGKPCDLFLDSDEDGIFFENAGDSQLSAEIYAGFRERRIGTETIPPHSVVKLPVPGTGLVCIENSR